MASLYATFATPLRPVSPFSAESASLFWLTFWISLVIFLLVAGFITYNLIRFRGAGRPEPLLSAARETGIEAVWTLIPLVILAILFVVSFRTAGAIQAVHPSTEGEDPELIIIGHQWWWEVRYPGSDAVTANEIHIPTGQRLLVRLESADVIHDFWVPQIGRKMDAIPGHPNHFWIQADQPGTYLGACAEFCGIQHAWMRLRVVATEPEQFRRWLSEEGQPIAAPATAQAERGRELFVERACAACHAVRGVAAKANVGPDLTHLARRETLAAGVLANTPENLAAWLKEPSAIKPGSRMPNLKLSDDEIAALIAFLGGSGETTRR